MPSKHYIKSINSLKQIFNEYSLYKCQTLDYKDKYANFPSMLQPKRRGSNMFGMRGSLKGKIKIKNRTTDIHVHQVALRKIYQPKTLYKGS